MDRISAYAGRTFFSLAKRNFRIYIWGQAISQIGIWAQSVAVAWVVLQMTNSGTALGIVMALQFLPTLLFGPWMGVWVDRLPKRPLLMVSQFISGSLTFVLFGLAVTDNLSLPIIYAFTFVNGLVMAIDMPARQTFIFELVGEKHLQNAVTLTALAAQTARIAGPAIAGTLMVIPWIGAPGCFLFNAFTFVVMLVSLSRLRSSEMLVFQRVHKARGQIREGLKYAVSNRTVKVILLAMVLVGWFTFEFAVTLPLLAKYTFDGEIGAYATFLVAMGVGSVVGGLLQASRPDGHLSSLAKLTTVFGVLVIASSMMPTVTATIACLFLTGIFSIMVTTMANSMMQLHTKPEMRGRINALWMVIFAGSTPLGGPIMGWIAEHSSARLSLAISGIAALIAGLGIYAYVAILPKHRHQTQVFVPEAARD